MMTKQIENPKYANDHHTAISYDAVFTNEEGKEVKRSLIEVNEGSDQFLEIYHKFGDTVLKDNKQAFLEERGRQRRDKENKKNEDKEHDLFNYKTDLFDYNFVHNSSNKKFRRQIRRAQTIEEARWAATALLIYEIFGIEPVNTNFSELFTRISEE